MVKPLLESAYYLDSSKGYLETKLFFKNILQNDSYRYKKHFDFFMIFLVLFSVAIFVTDIREHMSHILWDIEIVLTLFFALEYLLRFWTSSDIRKIIISYIEDCQELSILPSSLELVSKIARDKFSFIIHPMSIIDLLSIHPDLRALRLFKIFRYSSVSRNLLGTLASKRYEFGVLLVLISITIFIASSLFFVFEAENPKVATFFDALYWSVITIATVGYGDIVPTTNESKILSAFLVFSGLGVIAMLTSLATATFAQKISALKEQKTNQHIENMQDYVVVCGFGKMGEELCHRLFVAKNRFVTVDIDKSRVERAKTLGYKAIFADASKLETLKMLGIGQKISSVVVVTGSDIANISITLAVRSVCKKVKLIAKANNSQNESKLKFAGADGVVGIAEGTRALALYLKSKVAFQAVYELVADDENALVEELYIPFAIGLGELCIASFGVLALAVKKNSGFVFNPKEGELLEAGDILIVLGRPRRVEGLRMRLARGEVA